MTTTTPSSVPSLAQGTWPLDTDHTSVGFTIRHRGVAKVRGRFGDVAAELFLGHTDALDGRRVTLAVQTTEPRRSFGLDLRETVTLVDAPEQPADVLDTPAEAWLRLTVGRLAPQHTPPNMQFTSDIITLDDLRQVFPGF